MKIGVVTTSYPRTEADPSGNFVAGFTRWLCAHLGEVDVVCAGERSSLFYRGGAPFELTRAGSWPAAALFSARLSARVAQLAYRWDVLISHWLLPCGAIAAALAKGRPHLAIAHGSDVRLLRRLPGGAAFVRRLAKQADLVYVSRALAVSGAPGRFVSMGIEVAELMPRPGERAATRKTLGLDRFTFLYLGRLAPEKGVERAISALPDGAALLVAGDGPDRARLERLAGGRRRRVQFLGWVVGDAKRRLLSAADALLIPSRDEGAPTVVLEAQAAGLAVIATRSGGLPELIEDGRTGLLRDPQSLPATLREVVAKPQLLTNLAAEGRAGVWQNDWSAVAPQLAQTLLAQSQADPLNSAPMSSTRAPSIHRV